MYVCVCVCDSRQAESSEYMIQYGYDVCVSSVDAVCQNVVRCGQFWLH